MTIRNAHIRLRRDMSVWASSLPVNRNQLAILQVLIKHANLKGLCDPCYATIARELRVSSRTVERWMPTLRADGFISWRRRYRFHAAGSEKLFKERDSNIYKICFPFTAEHVEWQRAGIDKSQLSWDSPGRPRKAYPNRQNDAQNNQEASKPVVERISAPPNRQNVGGKDNQDKSLVIRETRLTPGKLLSDYRQEAQNREWANLYRQLDWLRSHQVLQIELGAHDHEKNRLRRRKSYWLASERQKICSWIAAAKRQGLGCFIRAADPKHRLLFLDDLDAGAVRSAEKDGREGLVIESSEGNYQVWIAEAKSMTAASRHKAQQQLIVEYGADPAASSGTQFARVAGTINTKSGREAFLTRCGRLSGFSPTPTLGSHSSSARVSKIQEKPQKKSHSVKQDGSDQSAKEFGWTCAAVNVGVSEGRILENLTARRASRKPDREIDDAKRYAVRTLGAARLAVGQDH